MEFEVNANNVILKQIDQIESGEYNITECNFVFSNEYDGLTKIAVFTGENGDTYKITILNNKCEIPSELLTTSQIVQIGVYAYEVQGTEFVLRYSPMPTRFMIEKGSYVVNAVNMSRPTPTEVEQLQSQITHNANDIEELQQNVSENTTAIENLQNDVGDIQTEQTEQNTKIQKNTDDIVAINQSIGTINADIGEINQDINNLETNKADKSQLSVYSLITETGSQIELNINTTNYKMKSILKDKNGNAIFTSNEIDLPLESFVVSATYDNTTKEIVLTLQNGQTIRFSVADLVSGLVSEDDLQTILANYYTKTQIDNLLNNKVDKVQGKGLSTEDFTTAEKIKLAGIEAEANKTIVDNELNNTSENPVQNKVIYEALAEKQTQINNLQTDVEDLRNASLKVTGTGTDITLNNTVSARLLENIPRGKTSQVQLEGKNLFDINKELGTPSDTSYDANTKRTFDFNSYIIGITAGNNYSGAFPSYSILNNKITLSGQAYWGIGFPVSLIVGNTYNLSYEKTRQEALARISFYKNDGTFINNVSTNNFTVPNETEYTLIIFMSNTTNVEVSFTNIQLEEGSTATSYEPYCGGIPSPNPGYPQPIKNVTGNANVKRQNKNLALPTWANNFVTNVNNLAQANIVTYNNRNCLTYYANAGYNNYENCNFSNGIKFKENTQYTISFSGIKTEGSNSANFCIEYTDGSQTNMPEYSTLNIWENKTITSQPNKTIKYIRPVYNSGRVYIDIDTFQIEEGTTATSYVPHEEQNLPFTFAEGQFLADDEKLQDNGMYKKWKQVTFSGTTATLEDAKTNGAYYCNKKVAGNLVGQTLTFDEEVTNAIIQYELAEPDTIPYNSTQQAQYEAIKNARSYDDITYISSTSDEEGFDMSVVAIGDANKIMQSELQEIKSAVIALGGDLNV